MLFLDTETYSETPIKNGTYRYIEDAELMIATYAFDDGPVQVWDRTTGVHCPPDLFHYLYHTDGLITCHNSAFDRNVINHQFGISLPVERFRCTMVKAYLHGLPGALGKLSEIFKLGSEAKDKRGKALIHLFCKPRKFSHNLISTDFPDTKSFKAAVKNLSEDWVGRATRKTHPKEWQEFIEYAKSDITSLRRLDDLIPKWNITRTELAYWHLDQRRNDRGVAIDVGLAEGALRAVNKEQLTLKGRTQELTNFNGEGEGLESTSKRDSMLRYMLEAYGVTLPDLKMDTLVRRIEDPDLPKELKELLEIRLQVSTTSTSKYKSMLKAVNNDGRVRGLIQFAGAFRTGRDAGRTVQPQNFPSRDLMDIEDIELGIRLIKQDAADLMFDNIMRLTSSCLRQALVAGPNKKFIAADLSNIEGRYLAWAAEEEWKVQAFRDFDAGEGYDSYVLAYAAAMKVDPASVTKALRQIGKVMELGLGFGGGVGAFLTFAAVYGLDLDELARVAYDTLPQDLREEAEGFYGWTVKMKRSTFGLSKEVFVTCDTFKRMWRLAHPMTVKLWEGLENGCREAIQNPGEIIVYGRFKMQRTGQWLRLLMPSGRALCYPYPKVDENGGISFMGSNIYTRKWERIKTHGGKLVENCIAEGTPVLTNKGWLPIQQVREEHKVWDGVEFVQNRGCVFKGNRVVLSTYGVTMTPDHKVLTDDGWKEAQSCEGHNRFNCRVPDGYAQPRAEQRERNSLGGSVRMWQDSATAREGTDQVAQTGGNPFVRVHEVRNGIQKTDETWYEQTPRLRRLEKYGGPLSVTNSSGLEKLWRAGYQSVRRVADQLRELLARYGAFIPTRAYLGANGQHVALLQGQLPLENTNAPSKQSTQQCKIRHPNGQPNGGSSRGPLRSEENDVLIPYIERVGTGESTRPVYDIFDCGPRNRFAVMGVNGEVVIVHNCTQAGARDVFKYGELEASNDGYDTVFPVHDELVTEVPDTDEYSVEGLVEAMTRVPPWATGLPLAAGGFEGERYRKET